MVEKEKIPRYRPDPSRLSPEARVVLEEVRTASIPRYSHIREGGYHPIGSVSEYDPFILRRGKVLHVQAARDYVAELLLPQLESHYRRRGRSVEIIAEKGAVLLKGRRKQKNVASQDDFTFHPGGITFYVKNVASQRSLGAATLRPITREVEEPIFIPPSFLRRENIVVFT